MVQPRPSPGLERIDRPPLAATGSAVTVFAEDRAAAVTAHAHPAWKVVLSVRGKVEVRGEGQRPLHAPGVIVPPQLSHTCATTGPYVAAFVDAWRVDLPRVPSALDARAARRLLDAARTRHDSELLDALGAARPIDPRIAHVLGHLAETAHLDDLAADVGLSASRLRALTRAVVGIPLTRLRQWARLRNAVIGLGDSPLATAAHAAGFADQSHLTRLTHRLLGRTPASLKTALGPGAPPARDDRPVGSLPPCRH